MAVTRRTIHTYVVFHYAEPGPYVCFIGGMEMGAVVVHLYFYKEGTPIPANSLGLAQINLFFSERRVSEILATLRYEKPVYVWFNDVTLIGSIGTADEPPGEQEGT